MPPRLDLFTNRLRANSFGGAARSYDAHRPRYPDQLIDDLLALGGRRVLDVGAGTGIAAQQFAERGTDVIAVEPDARMAAIAREKGIPTEVETFESWDPAGRTFDLVVFASSFHWVDPALAFPKVREILCDGGRLVLLWNRLLPTRPTYDDFEAVYSDYMDADTRPMDANPDELIAVITAAGFAVTERAYPRNIQYSRQQWLDLIFTYSSLLTLDTGQAAELRARVADLIGPAGVTVGGATLAIVAAPTHGVRRGSGRR
jgi:SAM-dependent methyltransferase